MVQAISILNSIADQEVRHKPAVLATQLALQEQQQNLAGAIGTVQEGITWWQHSMTAGKSEKAAAQSWLWQQMVHLQLKAGDRKAALEAFQKLQSLDHTSAASAKMLGQLARASAQGNPQQALTLQSNLPPLPQLTGVNLDELEAKVAGKLSSPWSPCFTVCSVSRCNSCSCSQERPSKKRQDERKEKTTPFIVNVSRSLVMGRAAQTKSKL